MSRHLVASLSNVGFSCTTYSTLIVIGTPDNCNPGHNVVPNLIDVYTVSLEKHSDQHHQYYHKGATPGHPVVPNRIDVHTVSSEKNLNQDHQYYHRGVSQNVSIRHGYFCDIPSAQTAMDICVVSRGLSEPACYMYPAQKLVQPDGSFIVWSSTLESYVSLHIFLTLVVHRMTYCDVFEKYTNMCDRLLADNDDLTSPFIPSKDTTTICPSGSAQHGRARGKTQPTLPPVEAVDRLSIGMADTHHVSHEQITSELSHTKDTDCAAILVSNQRKRTRQNSQVAIPEGSKNYQL
ncbi:hypothetical protein Tco_0322976 [Tanacetum coccineum]